MTWCSIQEKNKEQHASPFSSITKIVQSTPGVVRIQTKGPHYLLVEHTFESHKTTKRRNTSPPNAIETLCFGNFACCGMIPSVS